MTLLAFFVLYHMLKTFFHVYQVSYPFWQ